MEPAFEDAILPYIKTTTNNEGKFIFTCQYPISKEGTKETCKKSFSKASKIKYHLNLHLNIRPFQCDTCGKTYKRNDHLQRHLTSHSDEKKPFECSDCGLKFTSKSHLSRHLKQSCGEEKPKVYECTAKDCGLKFAKKKQLKIHVLEHDCNKAYICAECEKSFEHPSKLKYHVAAVHAEQSFICLVCKCSFNTNEELVMHCKSEHKKKTKKKKVQCEVCEQMICKSSLKIHMRCVHEGVKQWKCEKCEKYFSTKGSLTRHLKICGVPCVKKIKPEQSLQERVYEQVGATIKSFKNEFKCPLDGCECVFGREYDLLRHLSSDRYHGPVENISYEVEDDEMLTGNDSSLVLSTT